MGADGWPTQDQFGLVFITEAPGPSPDGMLMDGVYRLSFLGNATLLFPNTRGTLLNQTFDSASGRTVAFFEVPPNGLGPANGNGQLWIGWTGASIGASPGAKDIVLLQPGCSPGDVFSPGLLQLVSRFDSLRFMDWVHTNSKFRREPSLRTTNPAPKKQTLTPPKQTT